MRCSAKVGLYVLVGHRFADSAQLRLTHCAQINMCVQWKERERKDRFAVHATKSNDRLRGLVELLVYTKSEREYN